MVANKENIQSQPRDIMHYESDIWAIADLLLAASVKQSDFPAYMMPFFALMMLEGRMLNAMKRVEEEEGLTVKDDPEDFKEAFIDMDCGYNEYIVMQGKTLSCICSNDTTFEQDFDSYLKAFDDVLKKLLGIERGKDEKKYLNMDYYVAELRSKKILLSVITAWSKIDLSPYDNSAITTLDGELSKHKQEASMLRRELGKLEKNLTGIADMADRPGAVFVVDVCREANAVKEAVRLGIPVVALVDTNADPDPIDYVIPGNDDSVKGVEMVVKGIVKVIKEANDEYSAKAAEESAKREQERKERDAAEKAARAERKAKAAEEKAAKGEAAVKTAVRGKKSGALSNAVKQAARAAKEAAESRAKADLAAKRAAGVAAAEAAVAEAEAPKAEEAAAPAAE